MVISTIEHVGKMVEVSSNLTKGLNFEHENVVIFFDPTSCTVGIKLKHMIL